GRLWLGVGARGPAPTRRGESPPVAAQPRETGGGVPHGRPLPQRSAVQSAGARRPARGRGPPCGGDGILPPARDGTGASHPAGRGRPRRDRVVPRDLFRPPVPRSPPGGRAGEAGRGAGPPRDEILVHPGRGPLP